VGVITREESSLDFRHALLAAVLLFATGAFAAPVPPSEYVFVQDLDRWVGVRSGESLHIGKLDAEGKFTTTHQFRANAGLSHVPRFTRINPFDLKPRPVYEMRSFLLVKGIMMPSGKFVPDPGTAGMTFEEYKSKFTPEMPPIWNLPGYFRKVDKAMDSGERKK
jgi:hypothetical protein